MKMNTHRKKPLTTSHGSKFKPVAHYVVARGGKICALAFYGFHEDGVLVTARPGEAAAMFRVQADDRSRWYQLETPKAAARRAIARTQKIISTVRVSLLEAAAARLLAERGRWSIRGVRE